MLFIRNENRTAVWLTIFAFVTLAIGFGVNEKVIALFAIIICTIGNALTEIMGAILAAPFIGAITIKFFALPIFWIINAAGYFISLIAIRRGFGKEVLNYRLLTTVFLVGFTFGFIIAKLI